MFAYYFMWWPGRPAEDQCERCTYSPAVAMRRGVQAMDYGYALMDLTVWGRQESWEESPDGWPQYCTNVRTDAGAPAWTPTADRTGRPIGQWPRLDAGYDDDLASSGPHSVRGDVSRRP
jgi:hypothetical protein